jgi:hypothetical protein
MDAWMRVARQIRDVSREKHAPAVTNDGCRQEVFSLLSAAVACCCLLVVVVVLLLLLLLPLLLRTSWPFVLSMAL